MQVAIAGESNMAADKAEILVVISQENSNDDSGYYEGLNAEFLIQTVYGCENAWEILQKVPCPDAIIIDIRHITRDKLLLCQQVKENPYFHDVPFIFLSSHTEPQIQSEAFSVGAADIIVKPPYAHELTARLHRHIKLYHKTRRLESLIYIDPLTHLPNAEKFKDVLRQEWARCARYQHNIALLLIRINHPEGIDLSIDGDNVYALTASIGASLCSLAGRPGDLFACISEDTFALLLSDCGKDGAEIKSSEIMQKMHLPALFNSHPDLLHELTCTIAYVVGAPNADAGCETLHSVAKELLANCEGPGIYGYGKILGVKDNS